MVQALNMAPLPTPVRAAIGLMADAVDAARTLPERAVELPVLAVSTALQVSLRAQQRYAEWTLRGDELLARLHEPPEEPPPWATFDDEEPVPAPAEPAGQPATTATTPEPPDASAALPAAGEPAMDSSATPAGAPEPPTDAPPAGTAGGPQPPSDDSAARAPSPGDQATKQDEPPNPPNDVPSQSGTDQPPTRRARVRKTTAAAAKTATTKTVRAPRQVEPSAFDRTDDD
jgi:hypothetical protein